MAKRVPPYIIRHKELIAERVALNQKNRKVRLRSSIFTLPEYAEHPDKLVLTLYDSSEQTTWKTTPESIQVNLSQQPNRETEIMAINRMVLKHPAKAIFILFKTLKDYEKIQAGFHTIEGAEKALVLAEEHFIAMSYDLFLTARGLDELFEKTETAITDLILRSELLGAELKTNDWERPPTTDESMRNIRKGRLIVNQGAENFKP